MRGKKGSCKLFFGVVLSMFLAISFLLPTVAKAATLITTFSGEQVVTEAKKYLGTPYVYGGTTTSGFDCSGLVQYVYKRLGYNLSRTTYTQVKEGNYVEKNNLQLGDLVFFGSASSPHHVGIYVGNNSYIHAPQTGDVVKISSLSSRSDYATARRIVQNEYSYTYAQISEVQINLKKCSMYTGSITGSLDSTTGQAIQKFRNVMGLPSGTNLDTSVINALNEIVSKPALNIGTGKKYATIFVQWWIGHARDGVYDSEFKECVRQWQIRAGIWSAAGADGVVREKDWGVMLK